MPYCTNCGNANPDEARFCSKCGSPLLTEGAWVTRPRPSASPAPPNAPRSPPTASSTRSTPPRWTRCRVGSALLVVQRGPGAGSRFLLDKDVVTAGRHADSEIFLDDVTVSRRHATFTREGDTFTVADAGQPQRHLRQPRPDRHRRPQGHRRGPDREVPPGVLPGPREPVTTTP